MAGGKGNTLRNAILDHVLGGPDYSRLATVYVALYTSTPSAAGGGTEVSTGGGSNYSRKSVTNDLTSWTATTNGVKSNLNLIDFLTAGTNWGTINAGAILSDVSAGYILYFGPLTTPKTINTNDGFRIPIGGLVLTES